MTGIGRAGLLGVLLVMGSLAVSPGASRPDMGYAASVPPVQPNINCSRTSVGYAPLTDMTTGQYKGFPGLLYNGSNSRPAAHDAAGLALAKSIQPMDQSGNPDPNGNYVLLSIGMSNTNQEFGAFIPIANAEPDKDSHLVVVNGAQGGQDAQKIKDPNAPFWTNIDNILRNRSLDARQVAAVWFKEADAGPNLLFPQDAQKLQGEFVTIMGIMKSRYPNLALAYLTTRIYAGYADTNLNPEPYAYQSGFAAKWLIEQQLSGDPALNYDPAKGAVKSPWLAWGAYTWADGLKPRTDGLIWECKDFNNDGTHPNTTGRAKVARMLMDFFRNDSTGREWFYSDPPPPPPNAAPTVDATAVASWPARKLLEVKATVTDNDTTKVEVTFKNATGATATVPLTMDSGGAAQSNWSGQIPAQKWPGPVYYSITATDSKSQTGRWPASGDVIVQIVDPAPPTISHEQKVTEAVRATALTLEAAVSDEVGTDSVYLLVWAPGDASPTSWKMSLASGTNESGTWTATLTLPDVDGTFRYAFSARDSTHEIRGPASGEFEITLKPDGSGGPGPGPAGPPIGGIPIAYIGAGVVALVVAAALALALLARRKRSKARGVNALMP